MVRHRPRSLPPSAGPSIKTNGSATSRHGNIQSPKRKRRSRSKSKKRWTNSAIAILLSLLAANFIALLAHIWHFLPDNVDPRNSSLPSQIAKIKVGHAPLVNLTRHFKKRVRQKRKVHEDNPSEALKRALSKHSVNRYDIVPAILDKSSYGIVHALPSIPDRRRMIPAVAPPNAVHSLAYFLGSRIREEVEDQPLFTYNPMLLPLDDSKIDSVIISDLLMSGSDEVKYVAVYRVSNFGNCHGPGRGVPATFQNYLGLALLDQDLNIVQDSSGEYMDVVIDVNQHLFDIRWTFEAWPMMTRKPKQYMQDCQLIAARSKNADKADRLILLCNEYAMPVRLQRRGTRNARYKNQGSEKDMIHFRNTYGSGLQLTALRKPNMILFGGKNMHYFSAVGGFDGHHGPGFLEIRPGGPHEFLAVDFGVYPYVSRDQGFNPTNVMKSLKYPEPIVSFPTIDFPPGLGNSRSMLIDRDSGSACCVSIEWNHEDDTTSEGRRLLMGFSHRKTSKQKVPKSEHYSYVSRLYAFEPRPPFDLVARSGFFCLGYGLRGNSTNDEAMQSDNEQIWGAANKYKLIMHGEEFNCPKIHFVSGIAEKMGDDETVIVSYGINDCYPRMVEVPKTFLVALLMPTTNENAKERTVVPYENGFSVFAKAKSLLDHAWSFLPGHNTQLLRTNKGKSAAKVAINFKKRVRQEEEPNRVDDDPSEELKRALLKDFMIRYDIVPTSLRNSYGVVHQLPSIPETRRMIPAVAPLNAVHNLTYFLESRSRDNEQDRPLFTYNPMLLPLDESVIDRTIISDLLLSNTDDVCYVGVYRVSNFGNCHGPGRGVPDRYKSYLGLALLDRDLNIVQDSSGEYMDVVIDLNQNLYDIGWSPNGRRQIRPDVQQYMQDCQLIAAHSKNVDKANRLILLCSEYAMPVTLQRKVNRINPARLEGDEGERIDFKNSYGSGLQLTALRHPNMILHGGKDMHYFLSMESINGTNASSFLEIEPGGPHEVLAVDFSTYPYVNRDHAGELINPISIRKSLKDEPTASFKPIDSRFNTLMDRDSGSACCISIHWKDENDESSNGRRLLLGFSHRKARRGLGVPAAEKYNCLSRVYAFDPTPPFNIVARSGLFCLGFALNGNVKSDELMQSDNEQIWGAVNEYKLTSYDKEFNCPRIHFVSGIAEKVGDEETAIISYGVNDCYPRMVEVPKKILLDLLRPMANKNAHMLSPVVNLTRHFKKRVRGLNYDRSEVLMHAALSKGPTIPYDIVPAILDQNQSSYGIVHALPSIPDRRRMIPAFAPSNAVHNLTYFLESRNREDEQDRPLFTYNPMLLPLDDSVIDSTIIYDLLLSESDDVCYVGVYRVSNFGNCHGPGRGVPENFQNYLGLALLDRDLNIIQDSSGEYMDVVVDMNQQLYDIGWSPNGRGQIRRTPQQNMQDCQLIAACSKKSDKADRLVLLCNSFAFPVRLQRRGNYNNSTNKDQGDEKEAIKFRNSYGSGLQLTALQKPNLLLFETKNMHYIHPAGHINGHGPGFLEVWPGGPHEFLSVDFATYPYVMRDRGGQLVHPINVMNSSKPEPDASFATSHDQHRMTDRDSGSACCVSIQWKDEDDPNSKERRLLLGFSHRKTAKTKVPEAQQYNYLSRLYAFNPSQPFDVVARSGFFCLGFALHGNSVNSEALQSDNEQIWGAANEYKLTINQKTFNCPRIHFVSGIAEKVGDNNTVIVSYGINDCYPRMIEVSKNFLLGLLRPKTIAKNGFMESAATSDAELTSAGDDSRQIHRDDRPPSSTVVNSIFDRIWNFIPGHAVEGTTDNDAQLKKTNKGPAVPALVHPPKLFKKKLVYGNDVSKPLKRTVSKDSMIHFGPTGRLE